MTCEKTQKELESTHNEFSAIYSKSMTLPYFPFQKSFLNIWQVTTSQIESYISEMTSIFGRPFLSSLFQVDYIFSLLDHHQHFLEEELKEKWEPLEKFEIENENLETLSEIISKEYELWKPFEFAEEELFLFMKGWKLYNKQSKWRELSNMVENLGYVENPEELSAAKEILELARKNWLKAANEYKEYLEERAKKLINQIDYRKNRWVNAQVSEYYILDSNFLFFPIFFFFFFFFFFFINSK